MFSVVIPLYNKELSITNTVQSVLDQTYQNFEIVIINDGSTDNSIKAVEAINDNRIRLIHQKNQGVSAARNKGVAEARFQWIAFLDGDDLWNRNHLQEMAEMIELFPQEKVFATPFEYSDNRPMFRHPRDSKIVKVDDYFKDALKESMMWTSIVVVDKDTFNKAGKFDVRLSRGEDLDLWARLSRKNCLVKNQTITAIYRVEAENRSDLNFNAKRNRVFHYSFEDATTKSEREYYVNEIVKNLRHLFLSKKLVLFLRLYLRHRKNISLLHVFKISPLPNDNKYDLAEIPQEWMVDTLTKK